MRTQTCLLNPVLPLSKICVILAFVGEQTLLLMKMRKPPPLNPRSEENTSELQSLMRLSYAVFCLKKQKKKLKITTNMWLESIIQETKKSNTQNHKNTTY